MSWQSARDWIDGNRRLSAAAGILLLSFLVAFVVMLSSLGGLDSRVINVGPHGDYPTILAALRAVERYGRNLEGPVILHLSGGHEYECRMSIDPAAQVYQQGLHLIGDATGPRSVLVGDGLAPVLNIDRISNVVIKDLDIRAGGCRRAVMLTNLSPPLLFSNVSIHDFAHRAVVVMRDDDHKSMPGTVEFENVQFFGGHELSTGLTFDSQTRAVTPCPFAIAIFVPEWAPQ